MKRLPLPTAASDAGAAGPGRRLTDWLRHDALPLWAGPGTDWRAGGFFEQLDAAGRPVEAPRRTRVVARQIYVFATALRFGWLPNAGEVLAHGLHFLATRLLQPDGTYASAVLTDGSVVNAEFDLYEQAFALFALAEAQRAQPDHPGLAEAAQALLSALRRSWAHERLGFREGAADVLPLKSNPHMHLLEAALAWSEVAGDSARPAWRALADELVALGLAHFIDPDSGAVREYFDADWRAMPGARGRVVEPGHQFEWAWLLARWGSDRGHAGALDAARRLVFIGEQHGVDAQRNVAVNEMDTGFTIVDAQAKLWPQTERLKAWCAMSMLGNEAERASALQRVPLAFDGLTQYFRPAPRGLWAERMDAEGALPAGPSRTSSLYHIVCAVETVVDTERRRAARAGTDLAPLPPPWRADAAP